MVENIDIDIYIFNYEPILIKQTLNAQKSLHTYNSDLTYLSHLEVSVHKRTDKYTQKQKKIKTIVLGYG